MLNIQSIEMKFYSISIVPALMLANYVYRLATAGKYMIFIYIVSLLFVAVINPYSLFKFIIFKIILVCSLLWFSFV